jgi:hypothetical protein
VKKYVGKRRAFDGVAHINDCSAVLLVGL